MRLIPFTVSAVITIALVFVLNRSWGPVPPAGKFFSPQEGFWQNADPVDKNYDQSLRFPQLEGKAEVYFDDRLVPHVFAGNDHDVFFIQGYLHAKFRLWQMELQVRAAAGRLSEVLGEGTGGRILHYDRSMRRLGMVYAAERSVEEVNKNPVSRMQYEAYTAGVNAYIDQLTESKLPLEYKLLDYRPERWTLLKTALFLKYMSYDLAGHEDDLQFTNARKVFSRDDFEKLFPLYADSLKPVVPPSSEDPYPARPVVDEMPPSTADSLYFTFKGDGTTGLNEDQPDKDNGSNNWAVSGSRTQSGRPILCNDPHLGLNLPSLWYEMQLCTPTFNAYGVSFPGSPNIIIGFNDSIAFGFTNAGRDVKDYYAIRFRNSSMDQYWYNGEWRKSEKRVEQILIKGKETLYDTVAYTVFGPVMYDPTFPAGRQQARYLAVRWKAHDPSNDGYMFYGLDHARNYEDYLKAIRYFTCPGQNCLFASKSGDIALWQQGVFPAKWRRQGDFVMPGTDSSYRWRGMIPEEENPHMRNPARGFVSSANQLAVDSTYPYYLGDRFPVYRGYTINHYLDTMLNITVPEMERMQTDNYNIKAQFASDILLRTDVSQMDADEKRYFSLFKKWDFRERPGSRGATVFDVWWQALEEAIWGDDYRRAGLPLPFPEENVLVEALHKDTAYSFIDDITTDRRETLGDQLLASLKKATATLDQLDAQHKLEWAKYKDTEVDHLLKLAPFSRLHIPIGGGNGVINAAEHNHGPSWRMIVQLTDSTEAYGVFPGGESGNPGSPYYDNFIDTWAAGKYYPLWVMTKNEAGDPRVKWTMTFSKGFH